MKKRIIILAVFAAISLLAMSSVSMAGSTNSNLNASANVVANCVISSIDALTFGSYDPTSASPAQVTGNINVRCTRGTDYYPYATGTREMASGGNTLAFKIGASAYGADDFAIDHASATQHTSASNSVTSIPLYGQIDAGIDAVVGAYTATLSAVVDF